MSTPLSSTDTESTAAELHSHVVTSTASATADIESSTTVTAHTVTPIASPHLYSTSRLPKLELPTFSGDPLSWRWDSFDAAVNNNPTLSPIYKFNYLKAQLQGDAAQAIAGLLLTEVNYSQSVTLLKQRFSQPEKLISAHTRALIELPGPTNELSSLQLFHDTTENHIRGLASLGVSKESYSTILVPIILGKLPVPIRRNLARDHNELRWTLDDLQAAVVKEIRILESGLYNNDSSSSLSTRTHPFMLPLKENVIKIVLVKRKYIVFTVRVNILPLPVQKLPTTKNGWKLFANQIFVSIVWGITKSHSATPSSVVSIADTDTIPACTNRLRVILLHPANQSLAQ